VQLAWNIVERVVQNRNRLPFAEFSEVDTCRLAVDEHVQVDGLGDVNLTYSDYCESLPDRPPDGVRSNR